MISASSVDRVEACPPSAVLTPRAEETSEYAEIGNAIHEYLRRIGLNPDDREAALACVPEELRYRCGEVDLPAILDGATIVGTEEAYAVDAASGGVVYLGRNIHREYVAAMQRQYKRDLFPTEVPTSLDVEAMRQDGVPVALDYKSGQKKKSADEMGQMIIQAYALAIKYDAAMVEVRVVYIDENGDVDIDKHTFTRMELDDLPERLRGIFARVDVAREEIKNGRVPTVYPGDHCLYCAALRSCPAQTALVRALLPMTTDVVLASHAMLTVEQVGEAWAAYKRAENVLETIKKSLTPMILQQAEEGVPAGGNYVYRPTPGSRKFIPAELARGAVIRLGGTAEDIEAITKTTHFTSIRKVKK